MPIAKPDHFLYGVSDLERAIEKLEAEMGLKAVPGGRHENFGTRNALVGLENGVYLELLGPDPEQPDDAGAAPILRALPEDGLITWCARGDDLDTIAAAYADTDAPDVIGPTDWRRVTPSGTAIEWRLLHVGESEIGALQPFFIDWGQAPHPTKSLTPQGVCSKFALSSPHAAALGAHLDAAGLDVERSHGSENAIELVVETTRSAVTLRSISPLPAPILPRTATASK